MSLDAVCLCVNLCLLLKENPTPNEREVILHPRQLLTGEDVSSYLHTDQCWVNFIFMSLNEMFCHSGQPSVSKKNGHCFAVSHKKVVKV